MHNKFRVIVFALFLVVCSSSACVPRIVTIGENTNVSETAQSIGSKLDDFAAIVTGIQSTANDLFRTNDIHIDDFRKIREATGKARDAIVVVRDALVVFEASGSVKNKSMVDAAMSTVAIAVKSLEVMFTVVKGETP